MPASFRFFSRTLAAFTLAGTALAVAACSSSGTSVTTPPAPTATPVPTATPTLTPGRGAASCIAGSAAQSSAVTIQNGPVSSAVVGGCSASITFSGVSAPVSATFTASLTAPANYPPVPSAPLGFTAQSATVPFYLTIKPNTAVTVGGGTALTFTVNSLTGGSNFFNLFGDTGPAQVGAGNYGGPGITSGNTILFPPAPNGGSNTTLAAGETYVLSLNYF